MEMERAALTRAENFLRFSLKSKLPVILQAELSECGLACVAMIAGYYQYETDLVSLRNEYSLSSRGMTLRELISLATRLRFNCRAVKLDVEKLKNLQLPCILHWGFSHYVVLSKIKGKIFEIHDPGSGKRSVSLSEINDHFTGVALELQPAETFESQVRKTDIKISSFWSRAIGLRRSFSQVLILSLFLQILALAAPFYMQMVIDEVLVSYDSDLLLVIALGFSGLLIIQVLTSVVRDNLVLNLSSRLGIQISSNLFRHLIRLPLDYFSKRHMGDILSRFSSLETIKKTISTGLVSSIIDGVLALFTLIAMLIYSSKLTLIVLVIVSVYACFRWLFFSSYKNMNEEAIVSSAKEKSHFMETVRAIQAIKIFGKQDIRSHQWINKLADATNKSIALTKWTTYYLAIGAISFGFENVIVIYVGARLVMDGNLTIGMLIAFISFKGSFIAAIDRFITQLVEFKMIRLHLDRLGDIIGSPTDKIFFVGSQIRQNERLTGRIEVRNLSFRYGENEKLLFERLNFAIEPGDTVGIIGESGCGKTTLLKCLMGLYKPTSGEIYIDNFPIREVPEYSSKIAAVMQEDELLSGSLAENISFFADHVDMDRVISCAKDACIHDDINSMHMKYETLIGDMGVALSGGQKQRVLLARALYISPKILFLDESTSHLDVKTEVKINENLSRLEITKIVIAHRPDTINSIKNIIHLDKYKFD